MTTVNAESNDRALALIATLSDQIGDEEAIFATVAKAMDAGPNGPAEVAWALVSVFARYVRHDPDPDPEDDYS
ncbi:hypothetical protein ACPYO6_08090 [Georgenia sp. Z1344]|uniref:hypothetical protein n=1 Tax=Georgenia sp. Z1344 TaxID=3416706 RepID=UPI003CE67D26